MPRTHVDQMRLGQPFARATENLHVDNLHTRYLPSLAQSGTMEPDADTPTWTCRARLGPGQMTTVKPAVVAPLLVAVAWSCAGEQTGTRTFTVRDSLGIRIVESHAPTWSEAERWTIDAEPSVDVGVMEGAPAYELQHAMGAARIADGSIVIADAASGELRCFDSEGRHLWTSGGQGDGPGEFQNIGWLHRLGDSLAAYDPSLRRVSVFDDRGDLGRAVNLASSGGRGRPSALGVMHDGSIVVSALPTLNVLAHADGIVQASGWLLRYDPHGALRDTIDSMAGSQQYISTIGSRRGMIPLPFGTRSVVAVSPTNIYAGNSGSYEVRRYDDRGALETVLRRLRPIRPMTPELIEAYRRARLERATSDIERELIGQVLDAVPFPDVLPAFTSLIVDTRGHLWMADFLAPGELEQTYSVFAPEGHLLGAVSVPQGLQIYGIGSDYVLGRWRDEWDVEHIRLHTLKKQ